MYFPQYKYKATIVEVHDADTIIVNWDMGRKIIIEDETIRLAWIDSNELGTIEGENAGDWLKRKLPPGTVIGLETIKLKSGRNKGSEKQEKYGRYLGVVWLDGVNLNEQLLNLGFAKVYDGQGPKPWS